MIPKAWNWLASWLLGPSWKSSLSGLVGLVVIAYGVAPSIFDGTAKRSDYMLAAIAVLGAIKGRLQGDGGAVVAPPKAA